MLGGLSALVLLIAIAIFASTPNDIPARDGTAAIDPALPPEPVTTMSPVQPTEEAATPQAATTAGVAPQWIARVSQQTGISSVAVAAYGSVSLRMAKEQPGCKVGWTTLAGIGGIESGHGTNSGSQLLADGTTSRQILGPALDGSPGLAAIRSDEESAQWHGDTKWDHAIGPMQFIPSTWEKWHSDGNSDGTDDPHNIFDSAYAAGRYLCASGGDLTTGEGWTRAVFSYNHSDDYVRNVLARANSYAQAK